MGIVYGSSYYQIVDGPTWNEAEARSVDLGGNLASVNSENENVFLYKEFASKESNHTWIGGTDRLTEGVWEWSNGSSWGYTNWNADTNEPNNSSVGWVSVKGEDYASFQHQANGKWIDARDNYIAEQNKSTYRGIAEVSLSRALTRGHISLSDIPKAYFSVSDLTIEEGESGSVTISRTGNENTEHTIVLKSSDSTAIAGSDYVKIDQTISFAAGETSKTITIETKEDTANESDETFGLTLSASTDDLVPAQIQDGNGVVTIEDDDNPTYEVSTSVNKINEGKTFRTDVVTTNVAEGTRLYWELEGNGVTNADFSSGSLKSSKLVGSDGKFSFYHSVANDQLTEGTEKVSIKLYSDWQRTRQVGETVKVKLKDTSLSANPTYDVSTHVNKVNEGKTFRTDVVTSDVTEGTKLYWEIEGNGITDDDFSSGKLKGSRLVGSDGKFSFYHALANDQSTEGTENLTVKLYSDWQRTRQVGDTQTVKVKDTSIASSAASASTTNEVTWTTLTVDEGVKAEDITSQFLGKTPTSSSTKDVVDEKILSIKTEEWGEQVTLNRVAQASDAGDLIQAKQNPAAYDRSVSGKQGSVLDGGSGNDILRGLGGWDVIDGGASNDLIHGGNGRDVLDGGDGADELHGDFGWNTYKSEIDGAVDLIAIKSDQHLSNWWYGKSGNSPNGEKADVIEGLDANDEIKIIGADTSDLTFAYGSAHGSSGITISAKGVVEAVYTGGDLSLNQIKSMTTGDASEAAINNQMWSYWSDNTAPTLLS